MKLKSLILGSVAAAGLSTAAFAADLGVLTSLDVCDELGLSGLTISSDTNCLQISGKVSYEFNFGDYRGAQPIVSFLGIKNVDAPNTGAIGPNDWESKVETLLKFVGTASSDFGPARAVINLRQRDYLRFVNEAPNTLNADGYSHPDGHNLRAQDAYVQIGDTTVISAGKKGTIFNKADDEPFNFTGLFAASKEDVGVIGSDEYYGLFPRTGGHVIQVETSFGEGIVAKAGLERLNAEGALVGVLEYSGAGVSAHISGVYNGLFTARTADGRAWAVHAGVTGTFDQFKLRAAGSAGGTEFNNNSFYNGLLSAEGTFDMFKLAASAEVVSVEALGVRNTGYGFGGSVGFNVTEGVAFNVGGRYFRDDVAANGDGYQIAAQLVAAVTETIKLTGEVGVYGRTAEAGVTLPEYSDVYGKAELAWTPGGGFTSSLGAQVQQNGAYKVTFKAAKEFN
jgi:hypothetical protein